MKQAGNIPRFICHTCFGADNCARPSDWITIGGPDLSLEKNSVRLGTYGASRSDVGFCDDDDRRPGPCIVPTFVPTLPDFHRPSTMINPGLFLFKHLEH